MWVMSSTICQNSQGNYKHSGVKIRVKGVELISGDRGVWGSWRKVIQEDYILVAVKTIMPCDTKRAKRYKPFLQLKHTHHGKRHDKRITRSIIMTCTQTTITSMHQRKYQGTRHPILTITLLQGSRNRRMTYYVPITIWGEVPPYVSFTVWWSDRKRTRLDMLLCNQDQRLHVPRQRKNP